MSSCSFPNCNRNAQANGFCIGHAAYASFTSVKVPKKINNESEKRKRDEKVYKKIVKDMAAKSNKCEVKAPGCSKIMEGLHHIVKRSPENLLDKKNLVRACNNCQRYIEQHPKWALEKLVSKSKFKKPAPSIIIAEADKEVQAIIIHNK